MFLHVVIHTCSPMSLKTCNICLTECLGHFQSHTMSEIQYIVLNNICICRILKVISRIIWKKITGLSFHLYLTLVPVFPLLQDLSFRKKPIPRLNQSEKRNAYMWFVTLCFINLNSVLSNCLLISNTYHKSITSSRMLFFYSGTGTAFCLLCLRIPALLLYIWTKPQPHHQ